MNQGNPLLVGANQAYRNNTLYDNAIRIIKALLTAGADPKMGGKEAEHASGEAISLIEEAKKQQR